MVLRAPLWGSVVLLAALAAFASPAEGQSAEVEDTLSVLDGVYTEEQAEKGEDIFQQECSACHLPSEFSGPIFEVAWSDRPVYDLYRVTAITMPQDRPGSLSEEEYAAVIAYILELNEYPAGEEKLGSEEDPLGHILIEPAPDGSR